MKSTPKIGLLLGSLQNPAEFVSAAQAAERAGFDEIWVSEDYFMTAGFSVAASVLATTSLPVGIGIVPAVTRHPGVLAMEIATLACMFPGRLQAGIGSGVAEWLDQMKLRPRSPLGSVRNTISALRTLLAGAKLDAEYPTFAAEDIVLTHPPRVVPPLYVGASGPKALQMSGEISDGTVLSVMAGVEYVRWAREQIEAGGGGPDHRIAALTFFALNEDRDTARERVRETFASYLLVGPRNPMTTVQGIADEAEALAAMDPAEATAAIPNQWLDELTVQGNRFDCASRLHEMGNAGAGSVVLCFTEDRPLVEMIDQVGRDVLPLLRNRQPA